MFEGLIPGVQLGSALAAVDRSTLDADSLVEVLIAQSRQLAHEQALLLADLVAVADAVPVAEFAPMEIGAALTWTRQAASAHLALAQDIVQFQAIWESSVDTIIARSTKAAGTCTNHGMVTSSGEVRSGGGTRSPPNPRDHPSALN